MDQITRHQFGIGLAGAVVGLNLKPPGDKVTPSVFGGVQVGVQSYTFRLFSVDKMIESMVSIGLKQLST
jgi:hypothetical protein